MDILYKRYFGRLRLLRYSDVEENPRPRTSRRLCRVVYANIRGLQSLITRGGDIRIDSSVIGVDVVKS